MNGAWFVMPRTPADWGGAAALWVTVAGWAGAAQRQGRHPTIFTPDGTITVEECVSTMGAPVGSTTARNPLSTAWRQFAKDVVRFTRATAQARRAQQLVLGTPETPRFVWQHHELGHRTGERLARSCDVPLIEYVHAPVVWEGRRWGVARRGWGRGLEALAERPQLRAADLVACVSEEVAQAAMRIGARPDRIHISPMGVDVERFTPMRHDASRHDRPAEFVVGWAGSFRRFHAIDLVIDAVARLRGRGLDVGLLLIGDGPDRVRLEALAQSRGLGPHVRFTGHVPNSAMPAALSGLDAAVITAEASQSFHYSPLKLREYLAMELPVVAPRLGDVERTIEHGVTGWLYEPGDLEGLCASLEAVAADTARAAAVGAAGRRMVIDQFSWDALVASAVERLDLRGT